MGTAQICKHFTIDIQIDCGNLTHTIFQKENVYLNFLFVSDEVCLHAVDCCFDRHYVDTPMSPLW